MGSNDDGTEATVPTVAAPIAMSTDQLTAILKNLQDSMHTMMTSLLNQRDSANASVATTAVAKAQEYASDQGKPEKKEFNQRFDPKRFQRLDKFSGGDVAWKP